MKKMMIIKFYPQNNSKFFISTFEDVRIRAKTYVYSKNDRMKKICSIIDQYVGNIRKTDEVNRKPYIYQTNLVDPTEQQLKEVKKTMLEIGKQQLNQKIEQYSKYLIQIEKNKTKLDK